MQMMQMIIQGRWLTDSPLTTLPHIEPHNLYVFKGHHELATLPGLMQCTYKQLASILTPELDEGQVDQVFNFFLVFFKHSVMLIMELESISELVRSNIY